MPAGPLPKGEAWTVSTGWTHCVSASLAVLLVVRSYFFGDSAMLGIRWDRLVKLLLAAVLAMAAFAGVAHACEMSSEEELFALLTKEVAPFVPSTDADGNTYLKGNALTYARINHYRKAYSDADFVKLSYERYASLTANEDTALNYFESRIIVVGPECAEIKLFQGELIGNLEVSLDSYLEMHMTAENLGHEKLAKFVDERVRIRAISIDEIVNILLNDLRFDTALMMRILPDGLKKSLSLPETANHRLGGELALLVFALKGGKVDSRDNSAFIFAPASYKGLVDDQKTVLLQSNGRIVQIPDMIIDLTSYALSQVNVPTTVLTLAEVTKDNEPMCEIDESGIWFSVISGAKIRKCAFNELLIESLRTGDWIYSRDRLMYPLSFEAIADLL